MNTLSSSFPPSARLHTPGEFQRMLRDGKRSHGRYFRLHVMAPAPSADVSESRLGITVSKRVSKRAVERNRIKRIVRESFRHSRVRLPPGDYLLVAKPECAGIIDALSSDLDALWRRAASLNQAATTGTMPGCVPSVSAPSD
jgi:ribonuclease P protein component